MNVGFAESAGNGLSPIPIVSTQFLLARAFSLGILTNATRRRVGSS